MLARDMSIVKERINSSLRSGHWYDDTIITAQKEINLNHSKYIVCLSVGVFAGVCLFIFACDGLFTHLRAACLFNTRWLLLVRISQSTSNLRNTFDWRFRWLPINIQFTIRYDDRRYIKAVIITFDFLHFISIVRPALHLNFNFLCVAENSQAMEAGRTLANSRSSLSPNLFKLLVPSENDDNNESVTKNKQKIDTVYVI